MRTLMLLSLLIPFHLWAAQPTLTAEKGQPWRLTFSDGREAVLLVGHHDSPVWTTKFKIIDNTCTNRQNMSCDFAFQSRAFLVTMVWAKHTDQGRVGKQVHRAAGGTPFENTSSFIYNLPGNPDQALLPDLIPQTLRCADWSWLPTDQPRAPKAVHVVRFDGEDGDANPETTYTESRTTGGYYGVDLVKTGPNQMSAMRAQAGTGRSRGSGLPLMLEASISLTFISPAGETCQVGISSSLQAQLQAPFQKFSEVRPSLKGLRPAVVGQDMALRDPDVRKDVQSWTKDLEEKDFE